jgi:hypothetical protein
VYGIPVVKDQVVALEIDMLEVVQLPHWLALVYVGIDVALSTGTEEKVGVSVVTVGKKTMLPLTKMKFCDVEKSDALGTPGSPLGQVVTPPFCSEIVGMAET